MVWINKVGVCVYDIFTNLLPESHSPLIYHLSCEVMLNLYCMKKYAWPQYVYLIGM